MNFLNNRQLSADGPEGVGGAIPVPQPGGQMQINIQPAIPFNPNESSNAGSAKGLAKGISSLNLKRGYGKGNKIERPLTVDEFEQNFVDLADEINNLKTDVTTALSGLSSVGSGPIKMIGKGTEIDLNPRHLSPQSITFDTEGIYVITDILITNPSAVITNASGGLFIAMDPFSYGNGNAKGGMIHGGMVPGNMVPGNMVPGNMVPGGMVPGFEEVEVGGLGAGLNQTIIGGHSESSLQGGGVLVAKTNDASLMRDQASTVYGEPNSNRGQGLQALTTGASFINTMIGGPSSGFSDGPIRETHNASSSLQETIMSVSSPATGGISLVQNTLVANELYFMILNPEESDVTCDVYVFGYKIAEVGSLREISSPTTTTTTTEKEEKSPIYFDRDSSEFVSSLEATIVSDGKGFETSYEVYFNTSALQTWFNEEIQKGSDITSIWIEPNLNGSQNGPTVPIIGFVDGSSVVENNSAHGMIAKFENLEFWLSNNPVYTLRIVAGGSQETTLLDTFTLMYESTTTTTTTANSAVTVSFLNQDANGPITWEDYDPSPLMELYRVRIKDKHEESKDKADKESPFELVFIENVNFNNDGTLQLELEYSAEYDQRTQGYNMFAYKVYNRSQESPYEKLESELIWYGILQVYANGMVYEFTGDDYPEAYNGVIARPFATSTPVSLTLTGVNGVVMDNVTLYHQKPETQLNYIFGFGNELKLLGVTDVNGQINVTADLEFFNADGTEYVYIVNEEFTDASTSIPYGYKQLYIGKSDIDKDTGILTINYTLEPLNGKLEVFTDNVSKFDQNGNQYPGQTIVINKLGDGDVWQEINWSWASGNSTESEWFFSQGLVSGTYKISLYDNNTGGTYADKGENGYINWDLISEEVVSLFWGETQLVDFRTPATTTTTTEDPATTTTTTEAP